MLFCVSFEGPLSYSGNGFFMEIQNQKFRLKCNCKSALSTKLLILNFQLHGYHYFS